MLFKNLFKPIEMYIIEVYECHGADIVSSLDYYTHFETKEECQAYCDKENKDPNNEYHLEPLAVTFDEWKCYMDYEDDLFNKIC